MRQAIQLGLFLAPSRRHNPTARYLRDKGVRQVSESNVEWLNTLRAVARDICREKGEVSADDLRAWCDANRYWPTHPNAYGAILTKREFVPGEFIQSVQAQRRGGHVRVWRLRDNHV